LGARSGDGDGENKENEGVGVGIGVGMEYDDVEVADREQASPSSDDSIESWVM
jgi:hypothetical protein